MMGPGGPEVTHVSGSQQTRSDQPAGHFSIIPKIEAPNEHNTGVEAENLHQTATRKPNCLPEMSNSNVSGSFSDVPDGLRKWSCKVKQPSRLPGCNFDISTRCISQVVENLPIVNSIYHMEA